MILPIPNLDDRTFAQLVDEARKLIPVHAPRWTDHNLSDPGMTLVELFAWLTEMQLYHLNVVTDAHLLKYLALLGTKPRAAEAARVELQLTPTSNSRVTIPVGTAFTSLSSESEQVFECDEAVEALPVSLAEVVSYANYRYTRVTSFNDHPSTYYHAFGNPPQEGDALYLGLDTACRIGDLAGGLIRFALYPYEEDLPPLGQGLPGEKIFGIYPADEARQQVRLAFYPGEEASPSGDEESSAGSEAASSVNGSAPPIVTWEYRLGSQWVPVEVKAVADHVELLSDKGEKITVLEGMQYLSDITRLSEVIAWEYWNGTRWVPLEVKASGEAAMMLSAGGYISFTVKSDLEKSILPEFPGDLEIKQELLWFRCRLLKVPYETSPRIDRLWPNIVYAREGETEEETWQSSGLPFQVFQVRNYPVIAGTERVVIDGEAWQPVEDFDASEPGDKHYVSRPEKGEFHFGDGLRGAVPPTGKTVTIRYRSGGGTEGNVEADTICGCSVTGITVTNPYPSHGGETGETVEEAFVRFKRELKVPYTAVTADDYEYIVRRTPGLRVARARAIISPGENEVTVVVIPYSLGKKPLPDSHFRQAVCKYLDRHRLVTTAIRISSPDYVEISVAAEVKVKPGYHPDQIKLRINESLDRFLSPLRRQEKDNEWPFGRPVYRSEINEILEGVDGVDCVPTLSLYAAGGSFIRRQGSIEIGPLSLVYAGTHQIDMIDPYMKCRKIGENK